MPMYFVLHAGLARLTGDYILSGKVLSLIVTGLLLGLLFLVLSRFGCPLFLSLALASIPLLTDVGLLAATTVRGDALAVLFQLGAIALIAHKERNAGIPAALLCALAIFTKLSAIWAPVAIVGFLYLNNRSMLRSFAITFLVALLVVGAGLQLASHGQMFANIGTLAFTGVHASQAIRKVTAYTLAILVTRAQAVWVLIPLALISIVVAITSHRTSIYHFAWVAAVFVLVPVMADQGTDMNHLLDLVVLTPILVGALWSAGTGDASQSALRLIVAALVLWAGGTAYVLNLRLQAVDAVVSVVGHQSSPDLRMQPILARLSGARRVLSEDATIPVARGELPVVLDPWMLPKIERRHPEWIAQLAAQIRSGEFDRIVLVNRYELIDPNFTSVYAAHLGPIVMSAIQERYVWIGEINGFQIYGPKQGV
jgi:hypothetical protein